MKTLKTLLSTGLFASFSAFCKIDHCSAQAVSDYQPETYYTNGYKDLRFFRPGKNKKKTGKDPSDSCYAIYDGENGINTAFGFKEMKLVNGDFYYPDLAEGSRQSDGAAVMFGLLGSAIAARSKGSVAV